MRLIDADALKNYIQNGLEDVRYFFKDNGKRAEKVIEGICEDIDEQPTIELPKWIPCSDRLPDIKDNHVSSVVIVYCDSGAYGFAQLEENIFGQVGWDCERDDDYHEPLGEVVAWMPLPEPYEQDVRGDAVELTQMYQRIEDGADEDHEIMLHNLSALEKENKKLISLLGRYDKRIEAKDAEIRQVRKRKKELEDALHRERKKRKGEDNGSLH